MAESLALIGASASILSIIHLLGKTVNTLHTLHARYQGAEFTFLNLIAQLTALKAALDQIQTWMDTNVDENHHQLVIDMGLSVTCCRMLVEKIDCEIEGLSVMGELDGREKIKLVLKNGNLEDLQKMIDRQTNALSLLLMACNCKAVSEQKLMLEKTSTRKVFTRIQDDASSLYVQRDCSSLYSRCTDNLSKISKKFEFDKELFMTKVYEKAIRGTMKDALQNVPRPNLGTAYALRKRTAGLDEDLKEDADKQKRIRKVLMMGDPSCAKLLIKNMRAAHGGFSFGERKNYREVIMGYILHVMEEIILIVDNGDVELDSTIKIHVETLRRELDAIRKKDRTVTMEAVYALKGFWAVETIETELLTSNEFLRNASLYFIEDIERLLQPSYLPTDADIFSLGIDPYAKGVYEHYFALGPLSVRMIDISSQNPSERKLWIHKFQDVTTVAFFVDLCEYDSKMATSLQVFDSTINSRWFLRSSFVLFLCNHLEFLEKLKHKPLVDYFPDYTLTGRTDGALNYLISQFTRLNRSKLDLFPKCDDMQFLAGLDPPIDPRQVVNRTVVVPPMEHGTAWSVTQGGRV